MSLRGLRVVADYYLRAMSGHWVFIAYISVLGLASRFLSILTFALIIKIFLSMFDQQTTLAMINGVLVRLGLSSVDQSQISFYLILPLALFVALQYVLGKVYLLSFRYVRRLILVDLLSEEVDEEPHEKAYRCYDYFLHGFEALIKCIEIVLFFGVLLIFIFLVNVIMGVSVIVFVPILVCLLVFRDRKEAFVQDAIRDSRNLVTSETEALLSPIKHYDQQLNYRVNGLIASELFGGMALVVIFLIYVEFRDNLTGYGLIPLLLIFAIRFAILYAGELSRQLSVVFRIRASLGK